MMFESFSVWTFIFIVDNELAGKFWIIIWSFMKCWVFGKKKSWVMVSNVESCINRNRPVNVVVNISKL